jgi:hypothetical protein
LVDLTLANRETAEIVQERKAIDTIDSISNLKENSSILFERNAVSLKKLISRHFRSCYFHHPILADNAFSISDDFPSSVVCYALSSLSYLLHICDISMKDFEIFDLDSKKALYLEIYPEKVIANLDLQNSEFNGKSGIFCVEKDIFQIRFMHSEDQNKHYSCNVHFPVQFHLLRKKLFGKDFNFIVSLLFCKEIDNGAGKSGSTFTKTADDRFILKFVKNREFHMYIKSAEEYFAYVNEEYPSVLVKVIGVYEVTLNKSTSYVVVMPNVFFLSPVKLIYDLKGSFRNRAAKDDRVLVDENFLNCNLIEF